MPERTLTNVIEQVLAQWDEPEALRPVPVLPAEHELAVLIERAVIAHFKALSPGQRQDLILGLSQHA